MLTMAVVERCPYTKAGTGVLRLSHSVVATLAGAVNDKNEWMALLVGTRSPNGLDIKVTGMRVPLQTRGSVDCKLVRPEPLTPEIVGVVHSHHSMRAFFSQTDDTELNPRFPVSIVVAQNDFNCSAAESLFGFNYKAEGRAPLPCKDIGIIDFIAVPDPFIDDWPVKPLAGYAEPDLSTSLILCPHTTRSRDGISHHCKASCGVATTEKAVAVFGRDGNGFMKEVENKTERFTGTGYVVHDNRYFGKKGKHKGYRSWDDDDTYLRHWGEAY